MNVMDAIQSRHSYRGKYKNTPVPRKDLIRIMQSGLAAPSGCNKQTNIPDCGWCCRKHPEGAKESTI